MLEKHSTDSNNNSFSKIDYHSFTPQESSVTIVKGSKSQNTENQSNLPKVHAVPKPAPLSKVKISS